MLSHSFRQLFDEHSAFVWRVLRRHGVPARELEDACQEVFLVVFRRLPEFEGRSSLRTWIYSISVRVALALRRRAYQRHELLSVDEAESSAEEALDTPARHETRQWLNIALAELAPLKREAFVLYELEGMTIMETASALGVPTNTALYRLYGARKELAAALHKHAVRVPGTGWQLTKRAVS